ncbi:MAG: hypothetical protein CVV24_15590, partial [Ignavibacteriae bacterium HGW-Ignavibacteriae-3]
MMLFTKMYPYKKLHGLCVASNNLIGQLLELPEEVIPSLTIYSEFLRQANQIYEYIKLYAEITELRKLVADADVNALSVNVEKIETEYIRSCQKYLEALGRHRILNLSEQERKDLTNYSAIVQHLAGGVPGNKAYAKLKEQQEKLFERVSKVLPVWSITNLSTGGHFPFGPCIFDLVVIDEASQSDIASALPLLFRAKKAIIIGDPFQLRHISNIRQQQDNHLMEKHGLLVEDSLRFSYSSQSLYDCSRGTVGENNVTLLNEHYRSHFSIIEFSNR